jgi:hypothetical protein
MTFSLANTRGHDSMVEDLATEEAWNKSSLKMMLVKKSIPDLFDNCKCQYAYNQRQRIYSTKVTLDNRPRVITLRIGENFMELSLSDLDGNILEMARQEDGEGASFSKTG